MTRDEMLYTLGELVAELKDRASDMSEPDLWQSEIAALELAIKTLTKLTNENTEIN